MAGPAAQLDEAKRFAEIVAILQKHHLVQGLTPEKVRDIFVDLGPTFVKFGQILSMRSDILPKEYCAALETLRTDVTPMPLTEVQDILTQAYARPWQEVFSDIGIRPLGSASIAQVHAATLTDGQRVVVKVQRPDLYDIMSRDVRLLKRAAALLKYTPLASALDFHAVLDEIWHTVQEELDFTIEANNIAEFKRLNDGVAYADCPATFPKWCTKNVLVMEYIAGHQIDDADGLRADGYDLNEIAVKLVHNYIRQITVYRFFHADPHPGNIRVQGGKIIWLDLGMMGRISPREAELYMGIIRTIYDQDVPALTQTLLALGQYDRAPDQQALTERIGISMSPCRWPIWTWACSWTNSYRS
jgi:ubiquinone biosynthesis protein